MHQAQPGRSWLLSKIYLTRKALVKEALFSFRLSSVTKISLSFSTFVLFVGTLNQELKWADGKAVRQEVEKQVRQQNLAAFVNAELKFLWPVTVSGQLLFQVWPHSNSTYEMCLNHGHFFLSDVFKQLLFSFFFRFCLTTTIFFKFVVLFLFPKTSFVMKNLPR